MSVPLEPSPTPVARRPRIAEHSVAVIAVGIYLLVNGVRFMLIKDFSEWDDVFVLAARRLREGLDIYQVVPQNQGHPYSYPPLQAFLVIPFTIVPKLISRLIWFLFSAGAALLMGGWAWRVSGNDHDAKGAKSVGRAYWIALLGLLCSARFIQDNLEHQQTDLVIGAILIGGCLAWQGGRPGLAATCWAVAGAMKGPALLFAPFLVWRGRWPLAAWMVILALAVNLLPDIVHRAPDGLWLTHWYAVMVRPMNEIGVWHSDVQMNQSLAGAARRFLDNIITPRALKALLHGVELAMLLVTAMALGRPFKQSTSQFASALECSMVLMLMLLFSPMSSKPHFCVVVLPSLCLARAAVVGRDRFSGAVVATCIILAILLDRNFFGRVLGLFLTRHVEDPALWFGSVMWIAVLFWIGCAWGRIQDLKGHPILFR